MIDHLPFLRAIAQSPHDDLPRLVYADALEESGEPELVARAHFIRGQIALAGMEPRSAEYPPLFEMIERFKELYHDTWLWDLPEYLRLQRPMEWVRGFIQQMEATLPELAKHGREIFDACPIIDLRLKSSRVDETLRAGAFDELPFLGRLTTLRVGPFYWPFVAHDDGGEESQFFEEFMAARVWKNVATLDLSGNLIDDHWLVRFVSRLPEAVFAKTLRTLDLSHCHRITDAGASALATARSLEGLTLLRLKNMEPRRTTRRMLMRRFGDRVEFS
jgi:uncharacterized protein (TIGR02996 family)